MSVPPVIVDCHHHFIRPDVYTPEAYASDCGSLNVVKTVHVEAAPDDGAEEVRFIEAAANEGRCKVAAIVAGCNLAAPDAADKLREIVAASSRVRGVRYILDFDGEATHPVVTKRGTPDLLRDPAHTDQFAAGFALLERHGLSFDLQCAPAQLPAAAALCAMHPGVPVVIDHLGKPRQLRADGGDADAVELARWRAGMAAMAALPQAHVKLSMLGYAVPGWAADPAKEALVRSLVLEVIALFGASRCMFNSNWYISGALSDSDDPGGVPLSMPRLFEHFGAWVAELSDAERHDLFVGSASRFYRIE